MFKSRFDDVKLVISTRHACYFDFGLFSKRTVQFEADVLNDYNCYKPCKQELRVGRASITAVAAIAVADYRQVNDAGLWYARRGRL